MARDNPIRKSALMAPGQRYGRLTAIAFVKRNKRGHAFWQYRCECGETITARIDGVRSGHARSCGCWQRDGATERFTTHGMCQSPEYIAWQNMLKRCRDPKHGEYPNYGGRGIAVCERWQGSFENFLADVGSRPSPKHSLDRYPNNDGNYERGNCRWATNSEQRRNQRTTRIVTFQGRDMSLAEAVELADLNYQTVFNRLRRGWPIEKALSALVRGAP